ncbi:MAG: DUF4129 domain-containing protein [Haloarculaceae archaeon]
MTDDRPYALALVVCCLIVVALLAGSVTATIRSSPDDAVDVSYALLPVSRDTGEQLKQALNGGGGEPSASTPTAGTGDRHRPAGGDAAPEGGPAGGTDDRTGASDRRAGAGDRTIGSDATRDLLAQLLALLRRLVPAVVVVLALAATAVVARNRDRIAASLRPVVSRIAAALDRGGRGGDVPDPASAPPNAVEWAWLELIRRAEVAPGDGSTPRQCVERAVREGSVDPDAARELTALFERVRYGGEPETPDHVRRALRSLRRALDGGER